MSVGQPELPRSLVHLLDELLHGAGRSLCERDRRVVRAFEQKRPQQITDADPLARAKVDPRLCLRGSVGSGPETLAEAELLEREERGHQFGGRGDRSACPRFTLVEHVTVARIDHDGRARPDLGWCSRHGERHRKHERPDDRAHDAAHDAGINRSLRSRT